MSEPTTTGATQEQLQELWGMLLKEFIRYLTETPREKIRVNRLEVIRQFLKDNNITIDGNHLMDVRNALTKMEGLVLPFDDTSSPLH